FTTNPYHDGDRFHWLMLCSGGRHGGIFKGKIIIRPGGQTYESLHSTANVAYTLNFPTALALNFSEADATGEYESCEANTPADKPYRWASPEQIRIVERETGGLLYRDFATAADGGSEGVLELEQRSGHYLLTVNAHDAEDDIGPFTIAGPDGPLFEDVTVKRGQHWFESAHLRFRDGRAQLRFSGDWKIGALSLQTILFDTEDYVIDQPWWNMDIDALGNE
ncbi:MAG TPA: hypothetical protein QGH10_21915, partial [Armatimonadota bacterium]|nr:hypothetical protein [Armatimonadota bacterium]